MAGAVAIGAVLVAGILLPLVLYHVVRREHDQWETMTREGAERVARRDTDDHEDR